MAAIGVAMIGFIFTDFNIKPSNEVAKINGNSYSIEDYREEQNTLMNFYEMNYGENLTPELEREIENETWNRMIRSSILGKTYEQMGLAVSTDELKAMVAGDQTGTSPNAVFNEPHPIVRNMFTNPETGEFNRFIMQNYFNSLDREEYAQERARWMFIENEIVEEQLRQKYLNMITKGLRPTSIEVQDYMNESSKRVDFSYIARNYTEISDEEVTVSESELRDYYQKNIESYKTSEARSIEYVAFNIVPSETDDANARLWTEQTKDEFSRTEQNEMISYINSVSDQPFDERFYKAEELDPLLQDSLLSLPEGDIFGPYYQDDAYRLSMVNQSEFRPDSVRARHILIGYSMVGSIQRAEQIADSLFTVLEEGGNFFSLAREYSADESNRAIGGDLGWFREGVMEAPFNNACFENNTGDLVKTSTRFGVHIIRIEAQSRPVEKYQIASIVHNVIASNETDQEIYNRAVKFRGKATNVAKFEEQAKEYGLDPRIVPDISKDQRNIPGIENPASMIGWAYNAEEGDVSTIFSLNDQYIVAALTDVKEEGHADFESVKNQIEISVLKEKKGEALKEQLKEKMEGANSLDEIAAANNLEVQEASQVQFANTFVSGIGLEPYVVGATMHLPTETVEGPFAGENNVFLVSVTNRDDQTGSVTEMGTETRLNNMIQSRTVTGAYNALVDNAKIEDNRLRIFYGR